MKVIKKVMATRNKSTETNGRNVSISVISRFEMNSSVDEEFGLGPNDLHHLQGFSDKNVDSLGRSRLKARLFQRDTSDPIHLTSQSFHIQESEQANEEPKASHSTMEWENAGDERYQREKALRQKVQKSAFEARDQILELSSKLRAAESEAQMWKTAASLERDVREQAEREKSISNSAKSDLENKIRLEQSRFSVLESEFKELKAKKLELQHESKIYESALKEKSESLSKAQLEASSFAAELRKKGLELKEKEDRLKSVEESLRQGKLDCRDAEEKFRIASQRRDELENIHERHIVRIRNLESSVSVHAAKCSVRLPKLSCFAVD